MHEIHIRKGKLYFGGVLAMNDGTKNEMMQRIEKAALQLFEKLLQPLNVMLPIFPIILTVKKDWWNI